MNHALGHRSGIHDESRGMLPVATEEKSKRVMDDKGRGKQPCRRRRIAGAFASVWKEHGNKRRRKKMTLAELQSELPGLKKMSLEKNYIALSLVNEYGLEAFKTECLNVLIQRENEELERAQKIDY